MGALYPFNVISTLLCTKGDVFWCVLGGCVHLCFYYCTLYNTVATFHGVAIVIDRSNLSVPCMFPIE
jgi:hypothetical protein